MQTSATNRRLRVLLSAINKGTLIPQPDFQRRLVWSNKDKLSFIHTVLDGFPFPEIYIAAGEVDSDTGDSSELLVDGQQRITTLYEYFKAAETLRLDKSTKPYKELSDQEKSSFLEYEVVIRDLGHMSIDHIKTVFQKINSTSYGLNAMEIHNSRYNGAFKQCGEALASDTFFQEYKIFTAVDIRRMKDVVYSLSLIITVMSGYFDLDKNIEPYLQKYNENFDQNYEILSNMDKVFHTLLQLDLIETRAFKKNDLFTLIVEIYHFLFEKNHKMDISVTSTNLKNFYAEVERVVSSSNESAKKYHNAVIQGSNSRANRIVRGDIIQKIIEPIPSCIK